MQCKKNSQKGNFCKERWPDQKTRFVLFFSREGFKKKRQIILILQRSVLPQDQIVKSLNTGLNIKTRFSKVSISILIVKTSLAHHWHISLIQSSCPASTQGTEAFVVVQAYKIQPLPDPLFHTSSSPLLTLDSQLFLQT